MSTSDHEHLTPLQRDGKTPPSWQNTRVEERFLSDIQEDLTEEEWPEKAELRKILRFLKNIEGREIYIETEFDDLKSEEFLKKYGALKNSFLKEIANLRTENKLELMQGYARDQDRKRSFYFDRFSFRFWFLHESLSTIYMITRVEDED